MSSSGQATSSPPNFQLIINALADYANLTGIDLTKNPFVEKIARSNSPEAILELLQEREKAFKEYRQGNRRLINCLSPGVKVLHAFSGIAGEAVSQVSVTYQLNL
jgi:fungal STAND N-terminal Goodbye domain